MDIEIEALKEARAKLAEEKKRVRIQLKSARKRKSRLKKKASTLSKQDLFDLIQMREAEAQRAAGAQGAGTSKETGGGSSAAGGEVPVL